MTRRELVREKTRHKEEFNPNKFYENLETNYNLSLLEERPLLTAPFRLMVKNMHHNVKNITFIIIEEINKIHLKANGITTDPQDLLNLIDKIFERREEPFQLNNIYRQFVMAYGRIAFNTAENYLACYDQTRQP